MELPEIPQNLTVPNYLPLTLETSKEIGLLTTGREELFNKLDQSLKIIKEEVDHYVDFIIKESLFEDIEVTKNVMANHLQSITKILIHKYDLELWKRINSNVRNSYSLNAVSESEINISNLDFFQNSNQPLFNDLIKQEFNNNKHSLTRDNEITQYLILNNLYQFVKNIAFIIENPESPLPDDIEDDELLMEGGTISLKDPISLNFFRFPMKSRRCNHVYEREHILRHLGDSTKTCIVHGCESRISKLDLRPDELMLLRVKVFEAKKANLDQEPDIDIETL